MNFGKWIGLLVLVLSFYILWQIRQLVLLLLVVVVFATALNRLVCQLQKFGLKRGAAVGVALLGCLSVSILFVALIVPPFVGQVRELTLLVPDGLQRLELLLNQLVDRLPGETSNYIPSVGDLVSQLQPLLTGLANNFLGVFTGFFGVALSILLIVVLTVMMLLNPQSYRQSFIRLIPSFYRRRADQILSLCEVDLVNWIIGTLFNMVVIGVASGIVLWILGVRLVLANALLAGLMEAIPNVGPVISTVPPAIIALLDAPWKSAAVLIAYIVIQQLEQFLLVPVVMGQQVALLPAITLISQLFFASVFGFLGLFLAIPLLIIVRVLLREILVKDVLDQWGKESALAMEETGVTVVELPAQTEIPTPKSTGVEDHADSR